LALSISGESFETEIGLLVDNEPRGPVIVVLQQRITVSAKFGSTGLARATRILPVARSLARGRACTGTMGGVCSRRRADERRSRRNPHHARWSETEMRLAQHDPIPIAF
jgi:hypothetical protein